MSVIVTISFPGDPERLEAAAAENEQMLQDIRERAVAAGLIAHRFYGSENQLLVIDEWPDADSFQHFFGSIQEDIAPLMEQIGASEEPSVSFWRKLDSRDEYGWGAEQPGG